MSKQIFNYKFKDGAYKTMSSILKYPEQVDSRIDGKVCRLIVTSYTIERNLQEPYWDKYKKDRLYQIRVKDIDDKEFLALESLLEPLDEVVIVE